jgi:hypothetical protein
MTDWPVATCSSCRARIIFARTVHGKVMPVDAEPCEDGNVELLMEADGVHALVHAQPPLGAPPLHLSHFATCPQASDHRSR